MLARLFRHPSRARKQGKRIQEALEQQMRFRNVGMAISGHINDRRWK